MSRDDDRLQSPFECACPGEPAGAIGSTLSLGSFAPMPVSGTSLTDAATGRLIWSGRWRGSGAPSDAAQVGELTHVTTEALKGSELF